MTMREGYLQFAAVSALTSKRFNARIYKTNKPELMPGAFLKVFVNPETPKADLLHNLELIKAWLMLDEEVQEVHPDCFFLELEKIPRLQVYRSGVPGRPKQWRGRYPKGKPKLI